MLCTSKYGLKLLVTYRHLARHRRCCRIMGAPLGWYDYGRAILSKVKTLSHSVVVPGTSADHSVYLSGTCAVASPAPTSGELRASRHAIEIPRLGCCSSISSSQQLRGYRHAQALHMHAPHHAATSQPAHTCPLYSQQCLKMRTFMDERIAVASCSTAVPPRPLYHLCLIRFTYPHHTLGPRIELFQSCGCRHQPSGPCGLAQPIAVQQVRPACCCSSSYHFFA
jgi:hypothetical protein